MVALASVSLVTPVAATVRAATGDALDGGFAQALAALAGGDDDTPPPAPQRQDHADDGKALPDAVADPAAPAMLDPRLLWLPAGLLPAIGAGVATPVASPVAQPVTLPQPAAIAGLGAPMAQQTVLATEQPATIKTLMGLTTGNDPLPAKLADLVRAAERVVTPQPPAQPVPASGQLAQPAPAIMPTLSTELAALGLDPTVRDDRKKTGADPVAPAVTMTTEVALRNVVQPTGETRHVPLDLRGDTGLQKMIDHIETLRDGADANDTRIRLVPDALGAVDVAVRRDGDAVHVRFSAENPATRALLTDAQPRLVELADARGVRIAGASVHAGAGGATSGGGHPPQPQSQPQRLVAAITNVSPTTTIDAGRDDGRLA